MRNALIAILLVPFFQHAAAASGKVAERQLRPLAPDRPTVTNETQTVDEGHFQLEMDILRYPNDPETYTFGDQVPRTPEKIWFDKADEAESMAMLKDELKQTNERRDDLKKKMRTTKDADEKQQLKSTFERTKKRIVWIQTRLDARNH